MSLSGHKLFILIQVDRQNIKTVKTVTNLCFVVLNGINPVENGKNLRFLNRFNGLQEQAVNLSNLKNISDFKLPITSKYLGTSFIYSNFFFAKTNAPIVAARSRNPAASTGNIYFENNSIPMVSIVPALMLASKLPESVVLDIKIM